MQLQVLGRSKYGNAERTLKRAADPVLIYAAHTMYSIKRYNELDNLGG